MGGKDIRQSVSILQFYLLPLLSMIESFWQTFLFWVIILPAAHGIVLLAYLDVLKILYKVIKLVLNAS